MDTLIDKALRRTVMPEKRKEGRREVTKGSSNFQRVQIDEISFTRQGKHHELLVKLIADLASLPKGEAIVVPKSAMKTKFENVRSALKNLSRKEKMKIKTGSDPEHFYIWKV